MSGSSAETPPSEFCTGCRHWGLDAVHGHIMHTGLTRAQAKTSLKIQQPLSEYLYYIIQISLFSVPSDIVLYIYPLFNFLKFHRVA